MEIWPCSFLPEPMKGLSFLTFQLPKLCASPWSLTVCLDCLPHSQLSSHCTSLLETLVSSFYPFYLCGCFLFPSKLIPPIHQISPRLLGQLCSFLQRPQVNWTLHVYQCNYTIDVCLLLLTSAPRESLSAFVLHIVSVQPKTQHIVGVQ